MFKLGKSQFSRNVITLVTGTGLAQILPVIAAPLLTRMYMPEEFGAFAFYFALIAIISVVATGRYELAIGLPEKSEEAFQLVFLSVAISLFVSLIIGVCVFAYDDVFMSLLESHNSKTWVYLIPISVFLVSVYQSLYYWQNREQNFKVMAQSKVIQSFIMVTTQLLLGALTGMAASGLILGYVLGQFISAVYMLGHFLGSGKSYSLSMQKQSQIARRYINFPRFLVIAHTLNAASAQLPSLAFNILFTSISAGYYMLIQRVVGAPLSLVGSAIGDVFRQQASEAFMVRKECKIEYKNALKKLVLISIFPLTVFLFSAPYLFEIIFGESWRVAGEYAQILVPMFFLQFVTSPLSCMYLIAEKQKLDLLWQTLLFSFTIVSMVVGYLNASVYAALVVYAISYSVMYIVNGYISFRLSKG